LGGCAHPREGISSIVRSAVLLVARAVRSLALAASVAALVIAAVLYSDGVTSGEVLGVLVAIAPPVVLWILWAALRELAELPERLRRLPETARERKVDVEQVAAELRGERRLVQLPLVLWRLRVLAGAARDLVTPHAPLLPFLSATFLTWSAVAAAAAVVEVGVAVVLLVSVLV
jgi:hypothetical protein